jgi:hypothetical protein
METPELKPCPFCGGPASLGDYRSGPFPDVDPDLCFSVGCANGGCIGHETHIQNFITAGEAIAAWNTRAPQEPQWEQMTEKKTFKDGEFIVIRRSKHYGYHKMFAQWSSVHGRFFSNSYVVAISNDDTFIRIPKY